MKHDPPKMLDDCTAIQYCVMIEVNNITEDTMRPKLLKCRGQLMSIVFSPAKCRFFSTRVSFNFGCLISCVTLYQVNNKQVNSKKLLEVELIIGVIFPHQLSDTMQPLAPLPFVQAGTSRRRSSTASLHHFPASPPSAFMGVPRSRRVSTVGSSIFSTPSTSAPPDTLQALQETSKRLPNESPQGTSGVPESRRGSQARRRSSVAASMLSSDTRDGKKGSIGFTLAASLVKWKKNSLRAARKANETIAKVNFSDETL